MSIAVHEAPPIRPPAPPRLRPRLDRRSNGALMDAHEFDSVRHWDERFRYELIGGVVVVSPFAGPGESRLNDLIGYYLEDHLRIHPDGHQLDLTVNEYEFATPNRRRPDRVIWAGLGRLPDYERDFPTIIIEIVSRRSRDRRRDYQEKPDEYLNAGAREYWVLDRFARKLTVFTPAGEATYGDEQGYESPLLPGLVLPLAELFDKGGAADRPKRPRKRRCGENQ